MKDGRGYCYGDSQMVTGDVIRQVYGIRGETVQINGTKAVIIG